MTRYVCPKCKTEQDVRMGQCGCVGCQTPILDVAKFWGIAPAQSTHLATPSQAQAESSEQQLTALAQIESSGQRPPGLALIILRYAATVLILLWSLFSVAWAVGQDVSKHPGRYESDTYLYGRSYNGRLEETAKIVLPLILPFACLGLVVVAVGLVVGLTLWNGSHVGWLLGVVVALGDAVLSIGGALFAPHIMSPAGAIGAVVVDLAIFAYLLRPTVRDYFF